MTPSASSPSCPTGPQSLEDVVDHFLQIYGDLLDDDEEIDELDDVQSLDIIRRNYTSGTCQAFAIALHDYLGFPIVALMGGLHVAVQCPDGQLMDFMGPTSPKQMAKRYGWKMDAPMTPWSREEAMGQLLEDVEESAEPWSELSVAIWVRQHLDQWNPEPVPAAAKIPRRRPR